jgi:hypothetical protein
MEAGEALSLLLLKKERTCDNCGGSCASDSQRRSGACSETIPIGVLLGAGFGGVVGISIIVVRHRPQLVRWAVAGLLLSCVIGCAHIGASTALLILW